MYSKINTWLTSYFYWAAQIQAGSVRSNRAHGSLCALLVTRQMAERATFETQGPAQSNLRSSKQKQLRKKGEFAQNTTESKLRLGYDQETTKACGALEATQSSGVA